MSSKLATFLVVVIIALFAFSLSNVFAFMTGEVDILKFFGNTSSNLTDGKFENITKDVLENKAPTEDSNSNKETKKYVKPEVPPNNDNNPAPTPPVNNTPTPDPVEPGNEEGS